MERELTPEAEALVVEAAKGNETAEHKRERKRHIKSDRFVEYSRALTYLDKMEDILDSPKMLRPTNVALVGFSNSGKTGLFSHFISTRAAPIDDPKEPYARIPALYVLIGSEVSEQRIYDWILDSLHAAYKDKDRLDKKLRMIEELFQRLSIQMLILDEFHHVLSVTGLKQRRCLNTIKTLTNRLQIPIVVGGIPETLSLLRTDPQIHNRFEVMTLPRWEYGMEFRQFLAGLEVDLPLLEVSNLGGAKISRRIYDLSEGLIGGAVKLVRQAAVAAVGKEEKITLESIEAMKAVPLSMMHSEAEKELYGHG